MTGQNPIEINVLYAALVLPLINSALWRMVQGVAQKWCVTRANAAGLRVLAKNAVITVAVAIAPVQTVVMIN